MESIHSTDDNISGLVSIALKETADELERFGQDRSFSPVQQRRFLIYAPFLRELARWSKFCKELSAIQIPFNDDPTLRELYPLFRQLLIKHRFPVKHPYKEIEWLTLLSGVLYRTAGLFEDEHFQVARTRCPQQGSRQI